MTALTDYDRRIIADARTLASLRAGTGDVLEHTGTADITMALACALGQAQHVLRELAAMAERLGGEQDQAAGDARRLGAIRGVLGRFDWELDDRQYTLELIDRIAGGGQP